MRHWIGLVGVRDSVCVGRDARSIVSEASRFGRPVERPFKGLSFVGGIRRAFDDRRGEIGGNRCQQFFGGGELALTPGDQVFKAAHEGPWRGIVT